jgi:hypothetical protein
MRAIIAGGAQLEGGDVMIEFLSTVAVIAPDPPHSRKLYVDALGLPLAGEASGYSERTYATMSSSSSSGPRCWPCRSRTAGRAGAQRS